MQEAFVGVVNDFGYLGIAFLIFIENVFPPIPSEAVLLFGGFMTNKTSMNILPLIITATIGSLLGASVLYLLGYVLGKDRLKRILSGRMGKFLHLKPENIDSADKWFKKHGDKTVLICRCIPIVRSLISIPAGISKMPFIPFILLTALGSSIWNFILIYIGSVTGTAWKSCLKYFGAYTSFAVVILTGILITAFIICKQKNK